MLIKGRKVYNPDNSYLLEYHARIETGEIIVGQELWQELENLREDFYLLSKSACIKSTIYCLNLLPYLLPNLLELYRI